MTTNRRTAARRQSISLPTPTSAIWDADDAREMRIRMVAHRTGRPIATASVLAELAFAQVDHWGARA